MSIHSKGASDQNPGGEPVSRRRFLGYVIGGISGAIAATVGVPLVGYFLSPIWKKNAPLLTPIARTTEIPIGQPTFVTYEQRIRDGWYISTLSKGAWVVNQDNNQFIVYDPKCTHLNCPYYWDKDRQIFHCPCHGGEFDINGNVLAGPPPRPLDRLEFTIQEGSILLSGKIIGKGT
jgi:menaquinol-cytochrome c reductase iron-sulfur subunit